MRPPTFHSEATNSPTAIRAPSPPTRSMAVVLVAGGGRQARSSASPLLDKVRGRAGEALLKQRRRRGTWPSTPPSPISSGSDRETLGLGFFNFPSSFCFLNFPSKNFLAILFLVTLLIRDVRLRFLSTVYQKIGPVILIVHVEGTVPCGGNCVIYKMWVVRT